MAITKADIVTALNERLNRAETTTTLADAIRTTLEELAKLAKWDDLHTSGTVALADGEWYVAKSGVTGLRLIDEITLNDGTNESEPLKPITWEDLLVNRAGSSSESEPTHYIERGANIYFYPTADAAYTVTVWYWRHHPNQDTILFGDQFREALISGTCMRYLENKGLQQDPKYADQVAAYGRAVAGVLGEASQDVTIIDYQDI